jgi:hypothetical protein
MRGQRVAALGRSPVQAFRILLFFIRVAGAAIDRGELGGMRKILFALKIAVTIGALQGGMRRGAQSSLVKGGWDSWLALSRAPAGIVAIQARRASRQRLGSLCA